ncbi:MAG TPA: hypothetical protein PK006_12265 [Saprospiraceae bacterium]|nr:hypothetical protein [Saprospiraceae bacterium]
MKNHSWVPISKIIANAERTETDKCLGCGLLRHKKKKGPGRWLVQYFKGDKISTEAGPCDESWIKQRIREASEVVQKVPGNTLF